MTDLNELSQDYYKIEKALGYLEENYRHQPSLKEVADYLFLSEFHFQKLFSRWVGISPKRFLQFVTKEYAKKLLDQYHDLLDTAFETGLSSPSRLYDLFINCEGVTPGEYKNRGEGITIFYGFHPSPFGRYLLGMTEKGICALKFFNHNSEDDLLQWLKNQWENSCLVKDEKLTEKEGNKIFGEKTPGKREPLHIHLKGTNFQIKVWEALLQIPSGMIISYQDLAQFIGNPKASRAVGNAVGKNPIPFLIPCHRIIQKMGNFGNYGEGPLRKKAILGWEAAKSLVLEKNLRIDPSQKNMHEIPD